MDHLKEEEKTSWIAYINSFQKKVKGFPSHSFVDKEYLVSYLDTSYVRKTKNLTKLILNITFNKKYILDSERLINSIRAESKQAISTLSQIGSTNELPYFEFTQSKKEIKSKLLDITWTKHWKESTEL